MKKKYLSLASAILSLMIAVCFVVFAIVLIFRVANGKEYVPEAQEGVWLIEVLVRIKKAGLNIIVSTLGIILSIVLVVYRSMLAYFYFKIFKSDDKFYSARLGENISFIVIAGVAIIVLSVLNFGAQAAIPPELSPLAVIFIIFYSLAFLVPLVEIAIVYISKAFAKDKKPVTAQTKDDIIDELDNLADKTATDMVSEKSKEGE